MHKVKTSRSGFTLIELLIVIVIVSILAIVVVLTINIPELLRQSRDGARFSDMKTLNGDVMLYLNELPNGNTGSSSTIYVSLPDKTLSGNQTSTCTSLGLPTPPTGYTYQCSSPQSFRHVDGTGWVPVNFSKLSSGAPLSALPVDPVNQSSTGLYYTYTTIGPSYVFTALPESQKQKQALGTTLQIPDYPDVIAQGTDVTVNPLFSVTGLAGYWNFDEGTGTTASDMSGNGNAGSWSGALIGSSGYYSVGKVGSWAGTFDGNTTYVVSGSNIPISGTNPMSISALVYLSSSPSSNGALVSFGNTGSSCGGFSLYYGVNGTGSISVEYYMSHGERMPSGTLSSGKWYHFVGVYSGSGNISTNTSFYINGVSQTLTNSGDCVPNTIAGKWYVNTDAGSEKGPPDIIDDVRVYSRALSAAEVAALYNAEK